MFSYIQFIGLVIANLLFSNGLLACAVCSFGSAETQLAYIFTTGVLTLAPLIFMGAVILFIYKKYKKQQLQNF